MVQRINAAETLAQTVEKSIATGSYSSLGDVVTAINAKIQTATGDTATEVKAVVASSSTAGTTAAAGDQKFILTYTKANGESDANAYGARTVVKEITIKLTA